MLYIRLLLCGVIPAEAGIHPNGLSQDINLSIED